MWMAQVAASGLRGTMAAAWPLARECRWLAARNPSLSFTRPSMRFFLPLLLLIRGSIPFPPSPFTLASPLYVVTSLIPGRQADRRTLKPCAQRAFPIFHLLSARQEEEALPRYPCFPSPCRNKTAATKRIDASRCKFVLFFTPGHPPRRRFRFFPPGGTAKGSPLTRDFYFTSDRLSRIVPRLLYKG